MKKILSTDGIKTETFHYDAHDGTAYIQSSTDVSGIIKANKIQRDNAPMRYQSEVFNHKARIPVDSIKEWCKTRGIKYGQFLADKTLLKKFLNDPDNSIWLTRKGRV